MEGCAVNPLTVLRRWFSDPDYWTVAAVAAIATGMVAGLLLILRGLT